MDTKAERRTIGEVLRAMRKAKGLSQLDLAQALTIRRGGGALTSTAQRISFYETDKHQPRVSLLTDIVASCGFDMGLFGAMYEGYMALPAPAKPKGRWRGRATELHKLGLKPNEIARVVQKRVKEVEAALAA